MSEDEQQGDVAGDQANPAAPQKREQSTISFPYLDLDTAIEVAQAVYNRAGHGSCDLDELAAEMGQTMSGAFRLKTGTAKIFDLTDKDGKSSTRLTELGQQIVAPDTEKAARAEAFMRVPLYERVYEKYKGHLLPPPKALEREMQAIGVSSKQTDKARQAFERSARQAGFFESGDDRLVRPRSELPTRKMDGTPVADPDGGTGPATGVGSTSGSGGGDQGVPQTGKGHPLIQGLILTLPEPDQEWAPEARASWLRMAASIFDMIYKGESGSVTVTSKKDTAAGQ